MSKQIKCFRCGHTWFPRLKRIFVQGGPGGHQIEHLKRPSKRCARCRSPYWNKMYVRNNTNRVPGSIGFQPPLTFPSHNSDAGTPFVRSKTISPPKRTVAGARKMVQTSQRRRAAAPLVKSKHGKTKKGNSI
jgi:hypothetical protein